MEVALASGASGAQAMAEAESDASDDFAEFRNATDDHGRRAALFHYLMRGSHAGAGPSR